VYEYNLYHGDGEDGLRRRHLLDHRCPCRKSQSPRQSGTRETTVQILAPDGADSVCCHLLCGASREFGLHPLCHFFPFRFHSQSTDLANPRNGLHGLLVAHSNHDLQQYLSRPYFGAFAHSDRWSSLFVLGSSNMPAMEETPISLRLGILASCSTFGWCL